MHRSHRLALTLEGMHHRQGSSTKDHKAHDLTPQEPGTSTSPVPVRFFVPELAASLLNRKEIAERNRAARQRALTRQQAHHLAMESAHKTGLALTGGPVQGSTGSARVRKARTDDFFSSTGREVDRTHRGKSRYQIAC